MKERRMTYHPDQSPPPPVLEDEPQQPVRLFLLDLTKVNLSSNENEGRSPVDAGPK